MRRTQNTAAVAAEWQLFIIIRLSPSLCACLMLSKHMYAVHDSVYLVCSKIPDIRNVGRNRKWETKRNAYILKKLQSDSKSKQSKYDDDRLHSSERIV